MSNKIKIVMYLNHSDDRKNACTVYRNITPLKYLKKDIEIKYVNQIETQIDFNPVKKVVTNIKIDAEVVEWADIVVFSRHYDQVSLMGCMAEIAKKMGKTVVYETDDLLHKIEQNFGKFDTGKSMQKIGEELKFIDYVLNNCDLVTVSTDNLKKYYSENYKCEPVTLPNCFDPAQWRGLYQYKKLRDFFRKKIRRDKTFRIGWQGGNNHFMKNFNYIVDPLNALKKKYGTKFEVVILSGQDPRLDEYSGERGKRKFFDFDVEWHKSVPVDKFPKALVKMDLDLGLVVVEDNEFSRAKSNIKWMEYGLLGIPAVSSRCEPYLETNAVLVDNSPEQWMAAIEDMMLNSEKCDKIGLEAREMALGFNIKNHAWKWLDAYRKAMAGELNKVGGSQK